MSRDSSRTYLHLHASHHADLFEEFTSSPLNTTNLTASYLHNQTYNQPHAANPSNHTAAPGGAISARTHTPGHALHHLPAEDILVPPHLQPINPEDEDDVVPDQHAAFGITQAMRSREGRAREWRDFDALGDMVRGVRLGDGEAGGVAATARLRGGLLPAGSEKKRGEQSSGVGNAERRGDGARDAAHTVTRTASLSSGRREA